MTTAVVEDGGSRRKSFSTSENSVLDHPTAWGINAWRSWEQGWLGLLSAWKMRGRSLKAKRRLWRAETFDHKTWKDGN
jgi:hypothetical protein